MYSHNHEFALPPSLKPYRDEIASQYKAVEFRKIRYSVFPADSCIRLPGGDVGKVVNIVKLKSKECLLVYKVFKKRQPYFTYPRDSQALGISQVGHLSSFTLTVPITDCTKAWLLPLEDGSRYVAIDLL